MDQNNEAMAMAKCVSTTDTDYVKAKSLNSTNAQDAQVEKSLLCAGGVR